MHFAPQIVAVSCAMSYAAANIAARYGMKDSNPATMTLVSFTTQTVVLAAIVGVSGNIPPLSYFPTVLFVGIGFVMPVIRMLSFMGIATLGASRSVALRTTHPLFGALFAVLVLREELKPAILAGTVLVIAGTFLISWQREEGRAAERWWYALFPLTAALITGLIQPLVRYGFSFSDYPVFFTALVGATSLSVSVVAGPVITKFQPLRWSVKSLRSLVLAALLENLGFLLFMTAFDLAPVATVSPLIATSPMWVVLATVVIFRDLERVAKSTIAGTVMTVAGTVIITIGHP
jgi:drug/metabolite transporter (DMT)-like permease